MHQYLGQHFLINKRAIEQIIPALKLSKGEAVIEIGPGAGALTLPLLEECKKVGCRYMGIEKDSELVNQLISNQLIGENTTLIQGDALRLLPQLINQLTNQPINYRLVGNIPYYITGALLRVISELPQKPLITVLMIQKEVAERLCAGPGKMNLLAAATQIWAEAQTLFTLPPTDFDPPPKVFSAVISLTPRNDERGKMNEEKLEAYYRSIKIIFKQPRKTLLNNLTESGIERSAALALLKELNMTEKTRAEELSVDELQRLSALM